MLKSFLFYSCGKDRAMNIEITAEKVAPTMSVLVEIFFIFFAFNYYLLT